MEKGHTFKILDHGYIKFIDSMGDDSTIVEAARMSTGKGFNGWYWEEDTYADVFCLSCNQQHINDACPEDDVGEKICTSCWTTNIVFLHHRKDLEPKLMGKAGDKRDLNLLEFLYKNKHSTPFEMGELMIEVYAPLMVYREWHRHRTQSYNEFSARYSRMPNKHYIPELSRFQKQSQTNKQGSAESLESTDAMISRDLIEAEQAAIYLGYETMLGKGIAKEVARINCPVSRYSKMRAKTDVRNWLAFLNLRMRNNAQWEIRQYANAAASIIREVWPKTFELFVEHDFYGTRFSRSEMRVMRQLLQDVEHNTEHAQTLSPKEHKRLMHKLQHNPEDDYRDVAALQNI